VTKNLAPSRILKPLGLAACLSLFGDLTLYTVLVTQLDKVELSLAAIGIMLSVNRLIRIPLNPLIGRLIDHWGRRRLFIIGMLLGVLTTASYGVVSKFWPFLIVRLLWGIAWTCIYVSGMAMVLFFSRYHRLSLGYVGLRQSDVNWTDRCSRGVARDKQMG